MREALEQVLVLLLSLGVGGALVISALLVDSVPRERAGTASGLPNSFRQTSGAFVVASLLTATAAVSRLLLPCG